MAGSWWHSVSRLLWSSSVAAACWHPGGENIFIWWNIFGGSCLDAGWWSQKSWWWCLQLQSLTMTALENAGALASWILETHLGLGQTSAGQRWRKYLSDLSDMSNWRSFLFGLVSCCVVQKYIVYRVLSSMMWAAAVAVSYITMLLIQWHNNFSHLILLFQLHWRAQFLSPWHHAIKRHLLYIILYILSLLVFGGGSGGVASCMI